ncbi:cytochrome P450 4d2-like [Leptinotarsa decemlineata]|uniref:cytochrome P450 4d2-like n=1 Tax=Leptinotarsa decemlineata TaxID=7539 RepID=UPI003D308758
MHILLDIKCTSMKWKQRRKMLTPSVHFSVVSSYLPIFKRSAEILVQRIYKHLETESVIDIHPFVPTFTLDIAGATSFGYDFGSQDFLKAVENFTKTLWIRNFSVWQRSYTLFKLFSSKYAAFKKDLDIIIGLSYRVIDNKREYYEKHGKVQGIDSNENSYKKKVALIDALLQLPGLSDRDIQ